MTVSIAPSPWAVPNTFLKATDMWFRVAGLRSDLIP